MQNYRRAAELTAFIRSLEVDGVTVSVARSARSATRTRPSRSPARISTAMTASLPVARPASPASPRSASRPARAMAVSRWRTARWPRSSSISRPARARRGRSFLRPGRSRPARRLHPAGRAVPPVPGCRDGGDPSRDRVPEPVVRAPGVPAGAAQEDRGLVLRERRRRAKARPDRRAVRVHDAQEGHRAVQARAVGPRTARRDPRRPATEVRVPSTNWV